MQFRNEEKTLDGNVKGSYGYKDANGIYRMVNYYSDASGFHAKVFSNEPGVLPTRRDHVNSVNRELFAKQTPLAYNPANVEWVINSNQPDFSNLNTMATEYNGDWRANNHNNQNSQLYREHYAFNGGDQYAGAASQVIESRRLNGVNSLYENEKQKLSLLVVPKNTPTHQQNHVIRSPVLASSILSSDAVSNFKSANTGNSILNKQPIAAHQPVVAVNKPLNQPVIIQSTQVRQVQNHNSQVQQQPSIIASQPPQTINNNQHSSIQPITRQRSVSTIANTLPQPQQLSQKLPQQQLRKERRRITGVRRVAKKAQHQQKGDQQIYFNSKIEIPRREENNLQNLQNLQNENLSLKEFSTKFPEKWHQIFSGRSFGNNYEDKSNQYAQLEAVAIKPDINVLADQSFMKPVSKKEIVQKQSSLTKSKIDRVGALPRKSVPYVPPINSDTLLTSATHSHSDQSTSSQMMPRMINPPTSTLAPQTITNKVHSTPLALQLTKATTSAIQALTPTTQSSLINLNSSSALKSINHHSTVSNPSSTESTTMSPTTFIETTTLQMNETNEKEEERNEKELKKEKVKLPAENTIKTITESPLTTSTSVSIVTSTSIDQNKKDYLKVTLSPIKKA